MSLPLIQRAREDGVTFVLDTNLNEGSACSYNTSFDTPQIRIPQRPLQSGEQYRFHFDMAKCIGCNAELSQLDKK